MLVLTKQVADLASTYTDVASRYILVGTYVVVEAVHEALAEAHDFVVALSLGIKV